MRALNVFHTKQHIPKSLELFMECVDVALQDIVTGYSSDGWTG